MTNVKKKDGKWFGAIVLSLILLFSLVFPYPVMADQTAADQTTAASVYAIHKTGDDKENFVIVIMGEGYTREQQEQFLKDATAKAQGLLKCPLIKSIPTGSIFMQYRRYPMKLVWA